MASRLVPALLIAAAVAAGSGCASASRTDAAAGGRHRPAIANMARSRAVVWAVGDSAGGSGAAGVARLIRRGQPDRVLYLGDVYNDGAGFQAFARLFGSMPVAPAPGNHDWNHGYQAYWRVPEWYSFTVADWRVIELNSETSRSGEQLRWLRALLRARGTCRIAFWHRPRFSNGLHGDATDMDPYWRALNGHARIVLSGHDHDMERFAPRGTLTQLVSGAGGESHYPLLRRQPGLLFGDATHWGATRLTLTPHHARIAFVSTSGQVLDSHAVACR